MRASAPPWPSRVPDRALVALVVLGSVVFLVLAAGNPLTPGQLVGLQLAFTPDRWAAAFADGATTDAIRSHLTRDFLGMMPGYTVGLTALFTLLWRRARARGAGHADWFARSAWLAVGVFVFDVIENVLMWSAADTREPAAGLVAALSTAGAIKWGLLPVLLLGPLLARRRA